MTEPKATIKIACPNCNVKLRVPAEYRGKQSPCPKCGTKIRIPAADEIIPTEKWEASDSGAGEPEQPQPLPQPIQPSPMADWLVRPAPVARDAGSSARAGLMVAVPVLAIVAAGLIVALVRTPSLPFSSEQSAKAALEKELDSWVLGKKEPSMPIEFQMVSPPLFYEIKAFVLNDRPWSARKPTAKSYIGSAILTFKSEVELPLQKVVRFCIYPRKDGSWAVAAESKTGWPIELIGTEWVD